MLTGWKLIVSNIAISIATFMIVLDYSIANVSIPYISGDLAVSVDQGTYVITSFAVGNAIVLPITGWLTKQIGAVKLVVASTVLFVLLSVLCGAAWSFEVLVIGRFLQGLSSGPLIPLSQSLLLESNPPHKKNAVLAFWSSVVIVAPIVGPILGGWLSFDYSWPWIFYINIPIGIISAFCMWLFLRPHETPIQKERLDWLSLLLLAVGVSCLQLLLDKGEQYDWLNSPYMRILAVTSFTSLTLLVIWSFCTDKPLIELKLFKIPSFSLSVLFIAIIYSIYFGSVILIPLWLQTNMGYNAIWAGIAVAPIGIVPFLFSTVSGKMVNKWGTHVPLFICLVLFSFSCFYTAYFDTDVDIYTIGFSRFLLGCAMLFFITPLFALNVRDLDLEQLPSGTGIFHFVRAMMGGVGTAVFTTLWIRRTAYHHAIVGENVTAFSQNTTDYLATLDQLGLKGEQGLAMTNQMLDNQAAMLAQNDCFYFMGWIFLFMILFLFFGRKKTDAMQPFQKS
jgi:DHA2 family multidrug resistance protein